jgi:anti-anti-sigma factor
MVSVSCQEYGGVIVISIAGEFYLDSIDYVERVWNEQMAKHPDVIGINCKNIKFVDSSAIGILVKFLHGAMRTSTEMIIFDLSDTIFNVFKTAKLGNFFNIMSGAQFEETFLRDTGVSIRSDDKPRTQG